MTNIYLIAYFLLKLVCKDSEYFYNYKYSKRILQKNSDYDKIKTIFHTQSVTSHKKQLQC
ncbi:MAG: hypothetical protein BGO87_15310 [Flavobacteriia bacterium 40-80]|nr:MAG: hypothetical protein BGO87_15310 [Flavobacteriia bacterium 40-80]